MQCCYRNFTQRKEAKFVVRLDLLIFTSDRLRKSLKCGRWPLTTAFVKTLVAFYQKKKNGFSIHGLLKRSSVQLSKLKSSAFWNPKVTQLTKSRCGRCPREQNTRAIDHLAIFLQLKKSTTWLCCYVFYPTK